MNQKIIDFCNAYKQELEKINRIYAKEPEERQYEINALERKAAIMISRAKLTDEEKKEILNLLSTEEAKGIVIASFESDEEKMRSLTQFNDVFLVIDIIETLSSDDFKVNAMQLLKHDRHKVRVLVSLRDEEKILRILNDNPNIKRSVIIYLEEIMRYNPDKALWQFMKKAQLENQVIPNILYGSKFNIVESRFLDEQMKKDIEVYLGKPLPENISQMSLLERIGVDEQAIQGTVITSKKQLGLNEFQEMYFRAISSEWGLAKQQDETRRKVAIRDFGGTMSATLSEGVATPKTWKELLLGLKRMEDNLSHHSEDILFNPESNHHQEALGLRRINGKYYVFMNGNHRMTLLKAKYLSEIMRANGDEKRISEIEEKYTIEASYIEELPTDTSELMGVNTLSVISQVQDYKIKIEEFTEEGKKAGYRLTEGKNIVIVRTVGELQAYLQQELEKIRESGNEHLLKSFLEKIKKWGLDSPENYQYKKAFEVMTGIELGEKKREEVTDQIPLPQSKLHINECGEIIRPATVEPKVHQEQQEERIQQKEESFRDEVGEENLITKQQETKRRAEVDFWTKRYAGYYTIIDKIASAVQSRYIKMKSDITDAIKGILKDRNIDTPTKITDKEEK